MNPVLEKLQDHILDLDFTKSSELTSLIQVYDSLLTAVAAIDRWELEKELIKEKLADETV